MKKFAAPLQAFAALFLCAGMAWMVFVLTSINPTPPTAADLQARNTQDLSFADMNSTAVALAKQMLVEMVPSPSISIFMPVTGMGTASPTPSAAVTLKPVQTNMATPTSTLYTNTPTATRKARDTGVPTIFRPQTETATSVPSDTEVPRFTAVPPTQPVPTDKPTEEPPPTAVPPTVTDVPTAEPIPTEASPTEPPIPGEPSSPPPG